MRWRELAIKGMRFSNLEAQPASKVVLGARLSILQSVSRGRSRQSQIRGQRGEPSKQPAIPEGPSELLLLLQEKEVMSMKVKEE